jgi:transposase
MEERRLLAVGMFQAGHSQAEVARQFGVSRTAASRWWRKWRKEGVTSLKLHEAPGRPQRIDRKRIRVLA